MASENKEFHIKKKSSHIKYTLDLKKEKIWMAVHKKAPKLTT